MNLYPRDLQSTLDRLAPAVSGHHHDGAAAVRQNHPGTSGVSGKPYVSMEDPTESPAQSDPRGFLLRYAEGAIFDEAQRWPELFSYLQGMVDNDRAPGRFVLTGSQQFGLMAGVTQSLAGRVGMTRLLPLHSASYTLITNELATESD